MTKIIEIIIVLIVIVGIAYWALVLRVKNTSTAKDANVAIEQVVGGAPSVAPSNSPTTSAVPAVNPIKKTNPFKNEYTNPFE